MLPVLYYAILIPLLCYGAPAMLIYLLIVRFYVDRLSASPQKSFFNSGRGKVVLGFSSLVIVLLCWGISALLVGHHL